MLGKDIPIYTYNSKRNIGYSDAPYQFALNKHVQERNSLIRYVSVVFVFDKKANIRLNNGL